MNVLEKNADVIRILTGYSTMTDEEKKQRREYMIKLLHGYVMDIAKKFSGFAEFEDLCQAGYLGIVKSVESYNPTMVMPTTYFKPHIIGEMQKLCYGPLSQHYATMYKKLKESVDKYNEVCGQEKIITDIFLTPDEKLANISGLSISTIKEVKQQASHNITSLSTVGDNVPTEYTSSPEGMFLQNEKLEELQNGLKELSPIERFILAHTYCDAKEKSIKSVTREINATIQDKNMAKTLNLDHSVDVVFIEKKREKALKKLRFYFKQRHTDITFKGEYLQTDYHDLYNEEDDLMIDMDELLSERLVFDLFGNESDNL